MNNKMVFRIEFRNSVLKLLCFIAIVMSLISCKSSGEITIYYPKQASPKEILAAKELQKYIFLTTDKLPELEIYSNEDEISARSIVLSTYNNF